ncbi:MAG: diacylglycerol kinase family protein [Gemmatimonadaceae bacterium]
MNALELPLSSRANSRSVQLRRVLLVVNPGSRAGRRALAPVTRALAEAGIACDVAETTAPRHATTLVRERLAEQDVDAVLTLGGDGTAMEAMTALASIQDAPPLGIIAVGTANVLARSLGIPLSPVAAIAALADAEAVDIDLGCIQGGPAFAIGLGIGLDATMIGGASAAMKRRVGFLAYAWSAMLAGLRLERFHAVITVDGVRHEVETSSVLVANFGKVLGDMLCFGEDIGHQDGLLDVCIYSPRSVTDAARMFGKMLFGGVGADRCVRIIRGTSVQVETYPPRPMQADGELLGLTPVDVTVEPSAVRVLVPRSARTRWRFRRPVAGATSHQLQGSST